MLALISSAAHAGIFDWITGMVADDQEEKPSTENPTSTTPTTAYEQVTCKFLGSNSPQTCYASNIDQSCTGTDSCTMTIVGAQGSQFYLKACGGVAYATFDNVDETVEFNCETSRTEREIAIKCVFDEATQTKICDPPEVPNANVDLKEQVTCKFLNSTSTHTCYYPYIQNLSCTGTGSCAMTIVGREGNKVDIMACGGVAYATLDNADETVVFNCEKSEAEKVPGQVNCAFDEATHTKKCNVTPIDYVNDCVFDKVTQTQKCTPVRVEYVKEQVTCKFLGSTSTQTCYASDTQSCSGTDSCTMTIRGIQSLQPYLKACGGVAYATLDKVDETVEFNCETYEPEKEIDCVFDEATQTRMCYPSDDPVVPVEKVKEQVTCKFLESKQLQTCYSALGETCEGETSCVMDITFVKGKKISLKSSCGGYTYVLIDWNNENVEFKCSPTEEVTPEQIAGRGFQRSAWECYDGANAVSQEGGCLPAEVWHKKAELYCEGHCYQDKSKCGINSFSVSEECHEAVTGVAQPTVGGTAQPVDLEKLKEEMEESKEETLFCKDSCPLDGKCYPFGYRKKGKFCSDSGAFTDQLQEDLACDNNFECSTNVCMDGQCVSSGLIQKIFKWI
jgi:hypothetical protein